MKTTEVIQKEILFKRIKKRGFQRLFEFPGWVKICKIDKKFDYWIYSFDNSYYLCFEDFFCLNDDYTVDMDYFNKLHPVKITEIDYNYLIYWIRDTGLKFKKYIKDIPDKPCVYKDFPGVYKIEFKNNDFIFQNPTQWQEGYNLIYYYRDKFQKRVDFIHNLQKTLKIIKEDEFNKKI